MKKSFAKFIGALGLVAGLLSAGSLSAATIKGSIGYATGFTPNNSNLTLATSIAVQTPGVVVGAVTGDFAAAGILPFTPIALAPVLSVNSALALPGGPVWSVGGFSLNLTSIAETFNTANSLELTGTGWVTGNGYEPTVGNWIATFNRSGQNFTFSASSSAVPEGGSAIALLGLALLGVETGRRRLKARKA